MSKVKICGIRTLNEARLANRAGAWAMGEIFAPSRRRIEVEQAAAINREIDGSIIKIGVFVDEKVDVIRSIVKTCKLDMVQLHGKEAPEMLAELPVPTIKSFSVKGPVDPAYVKRWRPFAYLFDTAVEGQHGGSGKSFDWDYLQGVKDWPNLIVAGGLHAGNVYAAIQRLRPLAVDVCSGVEYAEGGKDPLKIDEFMNIVREADHDVTR